MQTEDPIEAGYREAASGAQKLAESIDILLPALIRIAAAKGQTTSELAKLAEEALQEFEAHRGQRIERRKYMAAKARTDAVKAGAALAQRRAAGVQ